MVSWHPSSLCSLTATMLAFSVQAVQRIVSVVSHSFAKVLGPDCLTTMSKAVVSPLVLRLYQKKYQPPKCTLCSYVRKPLVAMAASISNAACALITTLTRGQTNRLPPQTQTTRLQLMQEAPQNLKCKSREPQMQNHKKKQLLLHPSYP